jgi:hypothetical protein
MSAFGIIEMTRQRIRPSLRRSVFEDCPSCQGTGHVKTAESMSIEVMRMLQLAANHPDIVRINLTVHAAVAAYLNNRKRRELAELEQNGQKTITVRGSDTVPPHHLAFESLDASGAECKPTRAIPPHDNLTKAASQPRVSQPAAAGPSPNAPRKDGKTGRRRGGRRRGGRGKRRSRNNANASGTPSNHAASPVAEPHDGTDNQPDYSPFSHDPLEDRASDVHNTPPLMDIEPEE